MDEDDGETERAAALVFLYAHGIRPEEAAGSQLDVAVPLFDICAATGSRLLVTGAYGHSRWREHLFGGVTEALLQDAALIRFFSV